jgi:two-component system, NarL family, response regulator NreC
MTPIRILLVDDHALFRAGISALLQTEADLAVVGAVGTAEEALDELARLRPDVVLMDLSMAGLGGIEGTRRVIAERTGARVVVLTVHSEEEWLVAALEAGASGYVTKESAEERLMEAVRAAASGEVSLSAGGTRLLLRHLRAGRPGSDGAGSVELLSGREREVLMRTAEGFTAVEIGEQLQISPKTVDTYRQRMMEKLNLHHRSELVRLAIREGLLSPAG